MSVLVVLPPLQARAAATEPRGGAVGLDERSDAVWKWALSEDGQRILSQGEAPPALWPRADELVVALPPQTLGWAHVDVPKVASSRLRMALAGLLEDTLLEDTGELHFALPPQARPGRRVAVAVMHRRLLQQALQMAAVSGRPIDRVTPVFAPVMGSDAQAGTAAWAHFQPSGLPGEGECQLVWSDPQGVVCLPLQGEGARALATPAAERPAMWSTTPATAALAEAWAGRPVPVLAEAQPWLQAAQSGWELRQFDLAPRHRGLQGARDLWRQVMGPAWRPARLGLIALVLVNVAGLQVWAWQEQRAVQTVREAQVALLKSTHPQVRTVLDAPVQMARETDRLREAAGQPGEADLEAALAAAAAAWPNGQPPPQGLRYERGQLTLSAPGFNPTQVAELTERLRPLGWSVEASGPRLLMTRRSPAAPRKPTP